MRLQRNHLADRAAGLAALPAGLDACRPWSRQDFPRATRAAREIGRRPIPVAATARRPPDQSSWEAPWQYPRRFSVPRYSSRPGPAAEVEGRRAPIGIFPGSTVPGGPVFSPQSSRKHPLTRPSAPFGFPNFQFRFDSLQHDLQAPLEALNRGPRAKGVRQRGGAPGSLPTRSQESSPAARLQEGDSPCDVRCRPGSH